MSSHKPFAFPAPLLRDIGMQKIRPTGLGPTGLVKFAAAALCLGLLAGCSGNPPAAAAEPMTRYPFTVASQLVTQPVMFQAGEVSLDEAEKTRLNPFLTHFLKTGGGVLEIRLTADANDTQAEARLRSLHNYVLKRGAQSYEVRLRRVTNTNTNSADGPLILSFESFTAGSIKCTRRNFPSTDNTTNMLHPDLGCSARSNIAAMIANPADLDGPRDRQTGDAMRRSRVIQKYRAGEPTEAIRGKNESSGSIRELGG